MSQWADPDRWALLRSVEACVICRQDAPMRGYACLVFRGHAVELHDLTETEGVAFMRDIRRLSAAVQQVTGAVKLNYEVRGNSIPHLHMHFYPRYPGTLSGVGQ